MTTTMAPMKHPDDRRKRDARLLRRLRGRLENPSPRPLPETERGRKTGIAPPLLAGEGAGGGVVRQPLRQAGRVPWDGSDAPYADRRLARRTSQGGCDEK